MKDFKPKLRKIESKLNTLKKFAHAKLKSGDESVEKYLKTLDEKLKKLIDNMAY